MSDHVDKEGRVKKEWSLFWHSFYLTRKSSGDKSEYCFWHTFYLIRKSSGNEPEYCFSFMEHVSCLKLLGIWTTMKARYLLFFFSRTFRKMSSQKAYRKMEKHRLSEYPPRFPLLSSELGDSVAHCLGVTAPLSFTKESSSDTMCYNTGSQHLLDQREASSVLTCQGFVC